MHIFRCVYFYTVCNHTYVYTSMCVYVCVCVCVCVYVFVYIHTNTHTYKHTYIQTHIHTNTHTYSKVRSSRALTFENFSQAVEIPDTTWGDVGGLEKVKQELMETVMYPVEVIYIYIYIYVHIYIYGNSEKRASC
jgi:hypothetical protein